MEYHVKDLELAELGKNRIEWAGQDMPVLRKIGDEFEKEKPFKGIKIGACLHVTTETANLMITLKRGGAIDLEGILDRLETSGYQISDHLEKPGDVAVRGGILEVFPLGASFPLRSRTWCATTWTRPGRKACASCASSTAKESERREGPCARCWSGSSG